MSHQDILPNWFSELRNIYKNYIDSYIALYQLKSKNDEELNSIYKMIKTNLIDSNKYHPQLIIRDILNIIKYNNRYTTSYLKLAKFISDDYPLHYAALNNSEIRVEFLYSHDAQINEKDVDGKTALHEATYKNNREIVELLILHGANINEKDNNGKTPLDVATKYNSYEIVKLLISYGANIN